MPEALTSPHASKLLASLQWQGDRNDCGPFTTATVLNATRNLNLDAITLAEQMNKPVWRGPLYIVRRVPNWATFPWGIVDVMRQYSLEASWTVFAKTDYLLQHLITNEILMPIIGCWKPLWAHVMSLIAWDQQQGWGFANTQYQEHVTFWMSDVEFCEQWKAMGHLLVKANP